MSSICHDDVFSLKLSIEEGQIIFHFWFVQKFENATEKLLGLGHRRDAMPVMLEHAAVLRRMAQAATETEIQHTYYLQVTLETDG